MTQALYYCIVSNLKHVKIVKRIHLEITHVHQLKEKRRNMVRKNVDIVKNFDEK